jgi:hypothetical protein
MFGTLDFVVEHIALLDSMTSYATNDSTQTIFESVYSVKSSFDSIPPVGCFGVRLECETPSSVQLGAKKQVECFLGYCNVDGVYGTVLMTGKGTFVVGKQQMAFDVKYFPLKDKGKTYPHLKTLYTVLGRIARPSQFTNTQGTRRSDPTDGDNEQEVTEAIQDTEFGQAGGVMSDVSDEVVSHVPLDCESSDDDLVQDVLDEMKESISNLPAFNPLEDKQTFRLPIPTELTVDPSAAEPPTNCPAEDALTNADESDESTGQVELNTFKTKITRVKPGCYIDSDRQGPSKSGSNRSCKLKALKPVINPLSTKSMMALNSNISESQHVLQKYISREALLSDKSIIVG